MLSELPSKNLVKYSCRCAGAVGTVVLISGWTLESAFYPVLFRAFTTFLLFFLSCLANVGLLENWEKKASAVETDLNIGRFCIGYFATFFILISIHTANTSLIERGLLPPDFHGHKEFYPSSNPLFWVHMLVVTFIIYVLVHFFHNFILLQHVKNRTERENALLKVANFESANQLLRQQVQPHFLFNALNVLKSLIRKYPDTAEAYLIRLSDFLRASFAVSKTDTARLSDELKLCEDYMEMQKIRFGTSLLYEVRIAEDDDCLNRFLPFFSLQPLLENAIKHNQLTEAAPLGIQVKREGDWICVSNNLQPKTAVDGSTGNGLYNLKERYRILSGDEVEITMGGDRFSVRIKLLDHEYHRNRG